MPDRPDQPDFHEGIEVIVDRFRLYGQGIGQLARGRLAESDQRSQQMMPQRAAHSPQLANRADDVNVPRLAIWLRHPVVPSRIRRGPGFESLNFSTNFSHRQRRVGVVSVRRIPPDSSSNVMSQFSLRHALVTSFPPFLAAPVFSQTKGPFTYPDTPIGKVANRFVEAFNTGERKSFSEFVKAHGSKRSTQQKRLNRLVDVFEQVHSFTGKLTPWAVVKHEPGRLALLARGTRRSGSSLRFERRRKSPVSWMAWGLLRPKLPKAESGLPEWKTLDELVAKVVKAEGIPALGRRCARR